jgi:hypothetical protein
MRRPAEREKRIRAGGELPSENVSCNKMYVYNFKIRRLYKRINSSSGRDKMGKLSVTITNMQSPGIHLLDVLHHPTSLPEEE